jgi:ureidoacrylate peracid hydrolase
LKGIRTLRDYHLSEKGYGRRKMKRLFSASVFILAMFLVFSHVVQGEMELLQTLEEQVNPKITALLIIDMQNDYVADKGVLGKIGLNVKLVQDAIPTMNKLIEEARKAEVLTVWIRQTHSMKDALPNYVARNVASVTAKGRKFTEADFIVREGSWGTEYFETMIRRLPSETEIIKHTYGSFENTRLEMFLKAKGIKTIICIGTATTVCVGTTAITGWLKGYYSIIPTDAAAHTSQADHDAFLKNHNLFYGFTPKSQEIIDIWKKYK